MPVPVAEGELSLGMRETTDGYLSGVHLMARAPPVQIANKMVAAQDKRVAKIEAKRKMNAAIPGDAKQKNAGIRAAQTAAKEQRKAKWEQKTQAKASKQPKAREPKPPGTPKQARPQPLRQPGQIRAAKAGKREQRKQAGKELKAAAERMKKTEGLPGRKETFTVGSEKRSGRDVRQAVMLSHLNENNQISHGKSNSYPKIVKPYPNPNYERDTKAKGQYVIPKQGLQEYPVKQGGGWTGGAPGNMRVLTSKENGKDKLKAVVGHDRTRPGGTTGHFEAVKTRELDELDLE